MVLTDRGEGTVGESTGVKDELSRWKQQEQGPGGPCHEYGMSLADGNLPEALSFCWVWRWGCVLESTLGIYSELKMSYERLQKSSQEVPIIQFSFQLCRVIGSFQSAKTCNASIFLAMEVIYIYLFYNYSPIDRAIPFSNRIIILNK